MCIIINDYIYLLKFSSLNQTLENFLPLQSKNNEKKSFNGTIIKNNKKSNAEKNFTLKMKTI